MGLPPGGQRWRAVDDRGDTRQLRMYPIRGHALACPISYFSIVSSEKLIIKFSNIFRSHTGEAKV